MSDKTRLDVWLYENGYVESREKGRAIIMAGQVYVNANKSLKAGLFVKKDDKVEVRNSVNPFVSRGGLKLQKAIKSFEIDLKDKVCADIGASTGGFTDCMLKSGALKVFAVDVGYGQLAWKLRCDPRVINLERLNFRYATKEQIPDELDFASVDVSFISLKLILPVLYEFLKDGGETVCLIKPQFEAGRENVGKKGVVRDKKIHAEVINNIINFSIENRFKVVNLDYSPIKGPEGNIEYLVYLTKCTQQVNRSLIDESRINDVVEQSHLALERNSEQ